MVLGGYRVDAAIVHTSVEGIISLLDEPDWGTGGGGVSSDEPF